MPLREEWLTQAVSRASHEQVGCSRRAAVACHVDSRDRHSVDDRTCDRQSQSRMRTSTAAGCCERSSARRWAWAWRRLGAVGGLWAAAIARFMTPNVINRAAAAVQGGLPGRLPAGRVETKYQREATASGSSAGLYRGRPQIFALRTACTHLGCITLWQESRAAVPVSLPRQRVLRKRGSTSKGPPRARWNAAPSAWPTTGSGDRQRPDVSRRTRPVERPGRASWSSDER